MCECHACLAPQAVEERFVGYLATKYEKVMRGEGDPRGYDFLRSNEYDLYPLKALKRAHAKRDFEAVFLYMANDFNGDLARYLYSPS